MKILENFLRKSQEKEIETARFCSLIDNSCDLIEFNLQTFETKVNSLSIPTDGKYVFDERICICLLPDNSLFCYGGTKIWGELIGITYLINKKLEIQILPTGVSCLGCIATYHHNFVYVFGASFAGKFNLSQRKWEKLLPIPGFYCLCNCITFNDTILISGYDAQKIFVLDLCIFSFFWVSPVLEVNKTKIFCKSEKAAYLIDFSGKIFQSGINDPFNWIVTGNCKPSNYTTYGYKVFYRNSWYFSLGPNIMKFDLNKKIIEDALLSVPHKFHEFEEDAQHYNIFYE